MNGDRPAVSIPAGELDMLLAAAFLYVDAFREGDYMALPQRLSLREVERIVTKYSRQA